MADIIMFDERKNKGSCKGCAGLVKVSEGNYICSRRKIRDDYESEDVRDIKPVVNGKKTLDWGACNDLAYVKKQTYYEAGRKPLPKIINTAR